MSSAIPGFEPGTLWSTPEKYLVHFDGAQACFAHMDRDAYKNSIFTDAARIKPAATAQWAMPLAMLLKLYAEQAGHEARPHFILHPAHCGSTLLARLLEHPTKSLVIREPFCLRQMATSLGATPELENGVPGRTLKAVLSLLSRSWNSGQRVIIKANVPVNFILPRVFEAVPGAAGIILYAPFEAYLLSVLRTARHRTWVTGISREMAAAIQLIPGLADFDMDNLDAAQSAALLWMAQMHHYSSALAANPGLYSLDCELLFSQPREILEAAVNLFELDFSAAEMDGIISGGVLFQYAKDPAHKFDPAQAAEERRLKALELAPEIDAARRWAEPLIGSLQLPARLPRSLSG